MPSFGLHPFAGRIKSPAGPIPNSSNTRSKAQPGPVPPGSAWQLLRIWLGIGMQSFGGGASTTQLIRREMIYKRGWMTDQDYSEWWALSTLTPGINLASFAIMIGYKLAGLPGAFACLLGMLLPSATITTLLTAGFTSIKDWHAFQAIMHGVIPAIIGISFVFVIQFARPLLKQSLSEGKTSLSLNLLFALLCAVLLGVFKLSAVIVLLLSAIAGAIIFPRLVPQLRTEPIATLTSTPITDKLNNEVTKETEK